MFTYSMHPGWYASSLPTMRQIGKGPGRNLRDDRFVWVEGEISADVDYNAEGNLVECSEYSDSAFGLVRQPLEKSPHNTAPFSKEEDGDGARFSINVEEANEFVESFNDRYGISKEFAELHAVDGIDAIELLIKDKDIAEKDANELREKFNDSDVCGCALEGTNIIAIFTNKPFVRRFLMQIISHELTHVAYER